MIHEFVVLKTDVQAADLPLTKSEVTEDDYTSMGEVAELQPGASGTMTATLAAGHYAIICNLPGHVSQGMAIDFTVQ
jgi:Sulfocyanin (SoxE).